MPLPQTSVASHTEAEVRRDFQKKLEEHERRVRRLRRPYCLFGFFELVKSLTLSLQSNIKTLILFAFVGFIIFAALTAVIIMVSDGKPDCNAFPGSMRKDCVDRTMSP